MRECVRESACERARKYNVLAMTNTVTRIIARPDHTLPPHAAYAWDHLCLRSGCDEFAVQITSPTVRVSPMLPAQLHIRAGGDALKIETKFTRNSRPM